MPTIIEPFRIKSVEPIRVTTREEREQILQKAGYNPFLIHSQDVLIDLLTDSGTSAMSAAQWGALMVGDESYAGSPSYYSFEAAVHKLTGMKHIIPTHQGRASEKILFSVLGGPGKHIPNNTHFDTTRANVEFSGAEGYDLLNAVGKDPSAWADFKGDMDVDALRGFLAQHPKDAVPVVMLTVTNNSGGGQPVSMANVRAVSAVCKEHGIPFFLDACRFAENSYFIKMREPGYADKTVLEIAQELFSYADGVSFSAKKDAFANIGGFLAMNDDTLAEQCRNLLIINEGFPTYGGLAGRDLEAIAQGLEEVVQEDYLHYRLRTVAYVHERLTEAGVPLLNPPGGHALYLDAKAFAPHIPVEEYPGQAITNELYLAGGIRGVEIGSVMFGKYDAQGKLIPATLELVRLAMPRRVYTQSHMDYAIERIIEVYEQRKKLKGYRITYESPYLRHFTARFEPV